MSHTPSSITSVAAEEWASLLKSRDMLHALLNTSSDGIWIYGPDGRVLAVSQTSQRMCGLTEEDLLGKTVFELTESKLWNFAIVPEVLTTGRQASAMSALSRTGTNALVTATPVFGKQSLAFVVVNERDITQLKQLEDELKQARSLARACRERMEELSMLEMGNPEIVAVSPAMRNLLSTLFRLARMEASNILILGESGTGKGVLASFFHKSRERKNAPFVQINCAALPEALLESELFGYERGAFTGAREQGKIGLFEMANGGTLFLDEIGELPLPLQAKLLTYLDNNEIMPVGGVRPRKVYCSIIAATNRNIEAEVAGKRFREDLYYRLNSFLVHVPPLRERVEDIFELSRFFLQRYNTKYNMHKRISAVGIAALQVHAFPGNIRELQNLIKRAVVLSEHEIIDMFLRASLGPAAIATPAQVASGTVGQPLSHILEQCERLALEEAMATCTTTREMALHLGISQPGVVRKLRRHKLNLSADRKSGRRATPHKKTP